MKKFALMFLMAVCFSGIYAQETLPAYKGNLSNEDFFNQSEFIFEGIPVSGNCFALDSNKVETYYGSTIIKVTEVYKGQLKTGTVELITMGGMIIFPNGDISLFPHDGRLLIAMDRPQVFFCVKSNISINPSKTKADNPVSLMLLRDEDWASIHVGCTICPGENHGKIMGLKTLIFNTKEEFYTYIKQFNGIRVPEKKTEKVKDGSDNLQIKENKERFNEFMKKQLLLADIASKNSVKFKQDNPGTVNNLSLTIGNQAVTGAGPYYFEFDVLASSVGNTYYSNAISRLDFNTSAFGANLVANNKITLTKGTLFDPLTYQTNAFDVSPTRINISLNAYQGEVNSWNRKQLTSTPIQLLHVKIELLPNLSGIQSNLAFAETSFTKGFSFYTTTANANWMSAISYDNTFYTNPVSMNISTLPVIANFTPLTIHAGTGDVLTINGSFFGNTAGNVLFKNDKGGTSDLPGLDDNYIVSWTNTQIKVKVPSYVREGYNPTTADYGGAGSGKIAIKNYTTGYKESLQLLNIDYSILNTGMPNQNTDKIYLAKLSCNKDILFTLNSNISSSAVPAIEAALNIWSTRLTIHLDLERDTNNNPIYVPEQEHDLPGKNVISIWDAFLPDGGMGINGKFGQEPTGTPNEVRYFRNYGSFIAIATNPSPNSTWNYNLSGEVPAGEVSFYQAFLHEIGHLVSLEHINTTSPTPELMFYRIDASVNNPIYNLTNACNPVVASLTAVINPSKTYTWQSPALGTLGTTLLTTPTISASGATTFCVGSVILTSSYATGNTWSTGSTEDHITVSTSGGYTVTVSQQSCTVTSAPTIVTVCPLVTSFAINNGRLVAENRMVVLNNTATNNPTAYMASMNSSFIGASWLPYSINPTFDVGSTAGNKQIFLKLKNAAGESNVMSDNIYYSGTAIIDPPHEEKSVTDSTISISEVTNHIELYPNPSGGIFNVLASIKNQEDVTIHVSNILGQVVYASISNNFKNIIDLSNFSNGLYTVYIKIGEIITTKKVLLAN